MTCCHWRYELFTMWECETFTSSSVGIAKASLWQSQLVRCSVNSLTSLSSLCRVDIAARSVIVILCSDMICKDAEISQCLRTHFMTNVISLSIVDYSWKLEEWEIPSEKLACWDVGWYRSLLGKRSMARGWNEEVVDIRYWKVRCFFNQHKISIPFLLSSIS